MKIKNLTTLLIFLLCSNLSYAKIYKWVDEDGVVQFSENKPLNSKNKTVEDISKKSSLKDNSIHAPYRYTTKKDYYYCGEEKIHRLDTEERLLKFAERYLNGYQKSLARYEESLKKYESRKITKINSK